MKPILILFVFFLFTSCCKESIVPDCKKDETFTLHFRNISGKILILGIDQTSIDATTFTNHKFDIPINYDSIWTIELRGKEVEKFYPLLDKDNVWIRPNPCATFNLWI